MKGTEEDTKKVENAYLYEISQILMEHCDEIRTAYILTQVAQQCVSADFNEYN